MQYRQYILTDLGYYIAALDSPGKEIWGLDNRVIDGDDQRFRHLGLTPTLTDADYRCDSTPGTGQATALAMYTDGATMPEGGVEIAPAEVVDLLVSAYGWPVGTRLVDGLPVGPDRVG